MTSLLIAVFVLGTTWGQSPQAAAPASAVEWFVGPDITAADKQQILELARAAGVTDPIRAESMLVNMPLGCFAVRVGSREAVQGARRTSTQVLIGRNAKTYCRPKDRTVEPGQWGVERDVYTREVWRVEDGSWYVDVALYGVSYDIARQIVLAMRKKTVVDRRTTFEPPFFSKRLPELSEFRLSKDGSDYVAEQVASSSGFVYRFAVSGNRVELLSAGMWIS